MNERKKEEGTKAKQNRRTENSEQNAMQRAEIQMCACASVAFVCPSFVFSAVAQCVHCVACPVLFRALQCGILVSCSLCLKQKLLTGSATRIKKYLDCDDKPTEARQGALKDIDVQGHWCKDGAKRNRTGRQADLLASVTQHPQLVLT